MKSLSIPCLIALVLCLTLESVWAKTYEIPSKSSPRLVRIPPNWDVFKGGKGLIAPHPANWAIHEFEGGAFAAMHPAQGPAVALIWVQPMDVQGRSGSVVQSLAQINPAYFPGAMAQEVRQLSTQPDVAQAMVRYAVSGAPFLGTAMCFAYQGKGVLYVAAARQDLYPLLEQDMLQMLSHFYYAAPQGTGQISGTPAGAQPSLPSMTTFSDPSEGAFSCPVPQGWKTSGGTVRMASVDVRHEVVAESPDGRILLRLGDTSIPPFTMPDQMMASFGMGEGQWYSPGYGVQLFVLSFLPGARFLTDFYLPNNLGQISNIQITDRPDLSEEAKRQYPAGYIQVQIGTGEVTFSANTEQGPRNGYGFCQTVAVTPAGMSSGTWNVNALAGYLCEPGLEKMADLLLSRMYAGFQINPQWFRQQAAITGNASNIVSQTHNEVSDIIQKSFEQRQATLDRVHEDWSRVNRGQVLLEDPATGERVEAPLGSNYYWRVENTDTYLGTETADRPSLPHHWVERMEIVE